MEGLKHKTPTPLCLRYRLPPLRTRISIPPLFSPVRFVLAPPLHSLVSHANIRFCRVSLLFFWVSRTGRGDLILCPASAGRTYKKGGWKLLPWRFSTASRYVLRVSLLTVTVVVVAAAFHRSPCVGVPEFWPSVLMIFLCH
jgi:hypothetical protein